MPILEALTAAVVAGAVAASQETASQAVKDGYEYFKKNLGELVGRVRFREVEMASEGSKERVARTLLEDKVKAVRPEDEPDLRRLLAEFSDLLKRQGYLADPSKLEIMAKEVEYQEFEVEDAYGEETRIDLSGSKGRKASFRRIGTPKKKR
jgi:hypothetical protein